MSSRPGAKRSHQAEVLNKSVAKGFAEITRKSRTSLQPPNDQASLWNQPPRISPYFERGTPSQGKCQRLRHEAEEGEPLVQKNNPLFLASFLLTPDFHSLLNHIPDLLKEVRSRTNAKRSRINGMSSSPQPRPGTNLTTQHKRRCYLNTTNNQSR